MLQFTTIKDVKNNLGTWCKTMRLAEKLSQDQLANELQMSRFTIAKLENGENPTLDTVLKVLQYFGQLPSLNDFVKSKNEEGTPPQSMY